MSEIIFFKKSDPMTLAQIAELTGAQLINGHPESLIHGIAPLESATPKDLAFIDNPAYASHLETTRAAAIICGQKFAGKIPQGKAHFIAREPYKAFAQVGLKLYPDSSRPSSAFGVKGLDDGAHIHPEAKLETNVTVDAGAVIGAGAEIGSGTIVAANAVIGANCRIGRNSSIGPGATITNTLIGNRVIIHAGARIGQDGFGFAMGPGGHLKVPQIGRVIIQDDVEIGAGTCVDRGANKDTIIGEGTKIDNNVQIGHNVYIGRHCVIVSQVGISGSTVLEDYVVLGGQVGIVGHVRIGMGAQIAGSSNVREDVPAGAKWGGTPAKPIKDWFREMTTLKKLSERKTSNEA